MEWIGFSGFIISLIVITIISFRLNSFKKEKKQLKIEKEELQADNQESRKQNQILIDLYAEKEKSIAQFQESCYAISKELENLKLQLPKTIQNEREKAVESSRVINKGKVNEQLAPFLPNFKWKPSDARFLGSPVDLIIFSGMTDGEITELVLVDIKSGKSALTNRERQIQKAIENKALKFETYRIN